MEWKSKKILQSSIFLIFIMAGTNFSVQKENVLINFGIIHENLSNLQDLVWPVAFSSLQQCLQTTKQDHKVLLLNPFCNIIARKTSSEKFESLKVHFLANRLFCCSKGVINQTSGVREFKRIVLSKFTSYPKELHSSYTYELLTADRVGQNNHISSIRKIESEFFSTTVLKNDTRSFIPKDSLKQSDTNTSLMYSQVNNIASTFSLHLQKSTSIKYTTNYQTCIRSKIYDIQTKIETVLEENTPEMFGDVSVTYDGVATPSLDLPTLQNSLMITILPSPSESEEGSFISHTSISNAFELRGSIRSQPSFSVYNQEDSGMTSTPVMSDSVTYSYSNSNSTESEEINANYSLVTSSTVFSSLFPAEVSLPGMSSSTSVSVSSALNDSFLNASGGY